MTETLEAVVERLAREAVAKCLDCCACAEHDKFLESCSACDDGRTLFKYVLHDALKAAYLAGQQQERERIAHKVPCRHIRTRGGNDYLSCDDCGYEWDYRKDGRFEFVAAAIREERKPSHE